MNKAAIIIVNYNCLSYLDDLFFSLAQTEYKSGEYDIFFVDNGSRDGSFEWARAHIDMLRAPVFFIENKKNLGFAGGNNQALREILQNDKYEFCALLNADTAVDPHWLSSLIAVMQSDSSIGAAQSLILLNDARDTINTDGNKLHYLGFGWSGNYLQRLGAYEHTRIPIGYASGAAVLYRVRALCAVGLFDEKLFMYHEDLELSWRMRLAGYRIVLAPGSRVYHKYEFSRNRKKWFWVERNRLAVCCMLYKKRTLVLLFPAFLCAEIGIIAYSIFDRWFLMKLRSYGGFILFLPHIFARRARVSDFRRVSDREILDAMVGNFSFPKIKNSLVQYGASYFFKLYFIFIRRIVRW
jgi:GT2 family glycosyltransferase